MKVYISPEITGIQIYRYVLALVFFNKNIDFEFTENRDLAELKVTLGSESDFIINNDFYNDLIGERYSHEFHFKDSPYIKTSTDEVDLLSTIFYCVNMIQEYNAKSNDFLKRFEFENSYQNKYNLIEVNHVQNCIDQLFSSTTKLSLIQMKPRKSSFLLSHDIDTVYGSLKEDGYHSLKHGKLGDLFGIIIRHFFSNPDWLCMDKIMKIENDFEFNSIFYWLLEKGKLNSDYSFHNKRIQQQYKLAQNAGWGNGLHKSLSDKSIDDELSCMINPISSNRFHFLNYNLPSGFKLLTASKIKLDSSVGFTEKFGFRNSYGLPFIPFNFGNQTLHNFLEVPMHIMDRTFYRDKVNPKEVVRKLIDWFEKNRFNTLFVLNFHNNFFSNFKYNGYIQIYKEILEYFKQSNFSCNTFDSIMSGYYDIQKKIMEDGRKGE